MANEGPVTDFEGLSWHDDTLYGLRFDVGDSFQGDWHADLVLDIDHIVAMARGGCCGPPRLPSATARKT